MNVALYSNIVNFAVLDPKLDVDMAKYVIANVGDRFCDLVEQEKEAMSWVSPDSECVT